MALVQLQGRSVNSTVSSVSHAPAAAPGLPPSGSAGAKHPFTPWSGSRSEVYTLSVVQLADPEHAEMMQLNATTSTKACMARLDVSDVQCFYPCAVPHLALAHSGASFSYRCLPHLIDGMINQLQVAMCRSYYVSVVRAAVEWLQH